MLQGARHEHIESLHGAAAELGVEVELVELRRGDQVDARLDGLILPGGESTAMRKASESEALLPALFSWIFFLTESYFLGFTLFYHSHVHLVLYSMFVGLELRTDEVCCWCSEEKVDHKIFIIQQKCNNTANIFVPEYIVVGDALTMGCAAEMKIYEYCIKQGMQEYSLQSNIKLDRYDQVMISLCLSPLQQTWSRMSLLYSIHVL